MKNKGTIRFAVVAAAVSLVAASCGADPVLDAGSAGGGDAPVTEDVASGGEETTTTAAEETTTTEEETTTTAEVTSDQAQSFRTLIVEIDDLDPDVLFFFDQASDARIDELADSACSELSPEQSTSELGVVAIEAYGELPAEEKALLDLGQFSTAFGTLAGFYCPEKLNLGSGDDLSEAMPDPDATDRDIQSYRDNVPLFLDPTHQAVTFVDDATDARLNELVDIACGNSSPDQTTNELGFDVLDVYSNDLTDAESDLIDVTSFAELYGTFLGWFCPESIPSGG